MRLTRRDLVATLSMAVIVALYAAYLSNATGWLVSSTRGTTAAVLLLGVVGGCAMGRDDVYSSARSRATLTYMIVATLLGITALTAAIAGLAGGSSAALAVLVVSTFALWLVATARHAVSRPAAEGAPGPLTHEVIDPVTAGQKTVYR
jgi:hypothetical protein